MNAQAECAGSTGRNKVVTYDTTRMHLENIMLSEESQREMVSCRMKYVQNRTIDRDRKQISGCQWLGGRGMGKTAKEYGVF